MGDHHCVGGASAIVHIAEMVGAFRKGRNCNRTLSCVKAGGTVIPCVSGTHGACGELDTGAFADIVLISHEVGGGVTRDGYCLGGGGGVRTIDIADTIGDGNAIGTALRHHERGFGRVAFRRAAIQPSIFDRGGTRDTGMEGGGQKSCGASSCCRGQANFCLTDFSK